MPAREDGKLVDVVVLAGRRNKAELRSVSDVAWEALVPIAGKPMAAWVIEALKASGLAERIVVVGPEELAPYLRPEDAVMEPSDDMIENVRRGAHAVNLQHPLLVATSDIPMLTPDAVRAFIEAAASIPAEFHYPVVERGDVERRFPGNKRTYVRMRDGTYTGGNIVLLDPRSAPRAIGVAEELVALRKKPWRLALKVGTGFMLRLLLGQVRVADAEERFSHLLGVVSRAVPLPYAEIGVDVDHPGDVPFCEAELRSRETGASSG